MQARPKHSHLTRRRALASVGVTAAAGMLASPVTAQADPKTFVLVHGSWNGGWVWKDVRRILERAGHDVYAPSLTGCGDRAHLLSPDVGLDTHIQDITRLIDYESLEDVILVGHSFGGLPITGIADQRRDKIRRIVFFDALVPTEDRPSGVPRNPDGSLPEAWQERMETFEDGYKMDFFDSYPLKMVVPDSMPEIQAILKEKITLHPMRTWTDELVLENGGWAGLPRTFIHCVGQEFSPSSERMVGPARQPGWDFIELDVPRMGMMTHPELVAQTLLDLA